MTNNQLIGIGTDIVEISRIEKSIEQFGDKFLDKLFTEKEIAYCNQFKDKEKRFAGRFAAKEAIAKALGKGFGKQVRWQDIEILPDSMGKPVVTHPKLSIEVSISHCNSHAIAMAIAFNK